MIKKNKLKLLISSIVILLPMLVGIFGKNILPDQIAVHWGIDGEADGWMGISAFFIIPAILLAIHWLCMILTDVIDKGTEQNKKIVGIVFWIIPMISLSSCGIMLSVALGHTANVFNVIFLILAVTFIVIGNYMPKTTRNRSMGIKIKWTLSNDENWRATHRFAGKVYVVAGFLCLLAMPLPPDAFPFVAIGIILIAVFPPIIYSYVFYKKQIASGKVTEEDYEDGYVELIKNKKVYYIVTAIIVTVLVMFLSVIMFTGKIETTLDDSSLNVNASFGRDITVDYEDIDSVEYREDGVDGQRIVGFASAKLLLGTFSNDEFGTYTRYTYTSDSPCIVIRSGENVLVLGAESEQDIKAIYDRIFSEISE